MYVHNPYPHPLKNLAFEERDQFPPFFVSMLGMGQVKTRPEIWPNPTRATFLRTWRIFFDKYCQFFVIYCQMQKYLCWVGQALRLWHTYNNLHPFCILLIFRPWNDISNSIVKKGIRLCCSTLTFQNVKFYNLKCKNFFA